MKNDVKLSEPFACTDIFATSLAIVEPLGFSGCTRFTFAVHRQDPHDGELERQIVAHLIVPAEVLAELYDKIGTALGRVEKDAEIRNMVHARAIGRAH